MGRRRSHTWIYFSDIERDYDQFNLARQRCFEDAGVELFPASTGIGIPAAILPHLEGQKRPFHTRNESPPTLRMRLLAILSRPRTSVVPLRTPSLGDAADYGSCFSRGIAVDGLRPGASLILLSGTAAIDDSGRSVGDTMKEQLARTVVNLEGLLADAGATFADAVSGVVYVKPGVDASELRRHLAESPLDELPLVVVEAEICRPELLVEIELTAIIESPPAGA